MAVRPPGTPLGRRAGWAVALFTVVLVAGVASAVYAVQSGTGGAGGVQDGSAFLSHWQQTAVASSTTPRAVPALASGSEAAPTVLVPRAEALRLDAAASGDAAVEWTFTETDGIAATLELSIVYSIEYSVGGPVLTASGTVYLETSADPPAANVAYELYWDAGAATGVTFESEDELSVACSAVGTCA